MTLEEAEASVLLPLPPFTEMLTVRLREYESLVEQMTMLVLQLPPPDRVRATHLRHRLHLLKKRVREEIGKNPPASSSKRLADLQAYVKQTLATLENVPLDEQVDYLQAEAYRLVGDVESLPDGNVEAATKMKKRIDDYRVTLTRINKKLHRVEKQQAAAENDSLQAMINLVDDLQENFCDFEHEFCKKHSFETSLQDNAKELMKNQQIQAARRQHETIESELFDL